MIPQSKDNQAIRLASLAGVEMSGNASASSAEDQDSWMIVPKKAGCHQITYRKAIKWHVKRQEELLKYV